jgi:fucose permease
VASEHETDGADDRGPPVEKTQGGREALVQALNVPTNAKRGFAFAILFTLAVVGVFIIDPGATNQLQLYYVALAFVLAITLGMLVTAVLVGVSAYRLSKEL